MEKFENENINEICEKHENFIINELKPRLNTLIELKNDLNNEINEYKKCNNIITNIKLNNEKNEKNYYSLVNIGEGNYVQSVIENCNSIYIHIGMGFHVELGLNEAREISDRRVELLEKKVQHLDTSIEFVAKDIEEVNLFLFIP